MSDATANQTEFSYWRTIFWPIHRSELKKFVPMLMIFFLLCFDYNVLRVMKDTLVVTAKHSGAEVIPFIKVWVMFPGAILMTFLYTRLTNRWSRETVFYVMILMFLGFFALFTFVLYPMRDVLHPHETADALQVLLPSGFKGMIAMFRNWTFSVFYAMSELWSNIILFLLCWGFANQITHMKEAKRFYGLFGVGANFSGIIAGQASVFLTTDRYNPNIPFGSSGWEQSMIILVSLILLSGLGALALFRWVNRKVLTDPNCYDPSTAKGDKKVKAKLSMRESFSYLMKSRYVSSIAIIMIAYNIVINLVEVVWKCEVRALFPDSAQYNVYMNQVSTIIGIVATLASLLISGNSVRKFGWTFTALLTPAIILVTCIGFFTLFFMKGQIDGLTMSLFGKEAAYMVVFMGSLQNIMSRAAKYTVFDATKEMSFVPLSNEDKIKGKASIDGVCSRLGKSGGSVIHQGLFLLFETVTRSAPFVLAFIVGIVGVWVTAVRYVGGQFDLMLNDEKPSPEGEQLQPQTVSSS